MTFPKFAAAVRSLKLSRPTSRISRHSFSHCRVEAIEPRCYLSLTFTADPLGGFGGGEHEFAVADLNGDGKPDIVCVTSHGSGDQPQVEVFTNEGNGKFSAPQYLTYSASSADAVAIGDFNGDGVPDIAVESANDATVTCYLGAGSNVNGADPSFLAGVVSSFGTAMPGGYTQLAELQTAHFGGSSDDLVASDGNDGQEVRVLLSTGGGNFSMPDQANILTDSAGIETDAGTFFAVTDLNGDGISDIAISTGAGVAVQFGTIGGSFLTSQYNYSVPVGADDVVAGDLNDDGHPDLVVENGGIVGNGDVSVLLNNGGGSFGTAVSYPVDYGVGQVGLGDFGDAGPIDIAISDQVLTGVGNGTFSPAATVSGLAFGAEDYIGADVNGDGHADLVSGDSVLLEGTSSGGGGGGSSGTIPAIGTNSGGFGGASAAVVGKPPKSAVGGVAVKTTFDVTVKNFQASTAKESVTIQPYVALDGNVDDAIAFGSPVTKVISLKAAKTAKIPVKIASFPSEPSGSYQLLATVTDAAGDVSTVGGPSLTIAPPVVTTVISGITPKPAIVADGKNESLTFTLTNSGNITAAATASVAISLSSNSDGSNPQPVTSVPVKIKLKAGATRYTVKFKIPPTLAAGTYFSGVTLDVAALGDDVPVDGVGVSTGLTVK